MSWRSWSPLQSQTVKDICNHMTEDEKKAFTFCGARFGLVVALFFAIPLSVSLSFLRTSLMGLPGLVLIVWIGFGIYILVQLRRKSKELLCSTQWAKSQGLTPDKV